jgi:regulator of RNase E activity RraA
MPNSTIATDLSVLTRCNSPTIANAIELFDSRPRDVGFLRPGYFCLNPSLAPIACYATTCTISSLSVDSHGRRESFEYWEHIESFPRPRIAFVQDLDPEPSRGCFLGEVNSSVHMALNRIATITNGGVRDVDEMRNVGFQALYRYLCVSHSYVHISHFGKPISTDGPVAEPGQLVQIDQHGVLFVPPEVLPNLEEAVREIERLERPVIDYCRSGKATRAGLVERVNAHLRNNDRWAPTPTY